MVLAQDTDVLLLDEPTTFLDLHHQLEVMEIIETLRDESDITIVVVLHDIEQAARLADQMVALKDGEIQAHGTPAEVVTEQLLADVFEIEAEVSDTPHGLRINPIRARHDGDEHATDDDGSETERAEEVVAE
jgi:iron complex transport system ATP-binding protein